MLCDGVADKVPDTKVEEAKPMREEWRTNIPLSPFPQERRRHPAVVFVASQETGSSLTAGDDEKATVTSLNDYAPRKGLTRAWSAAPGQVAVGAHFRGPSFSFVRARIRSPVQKRAPAAAFYGTTAWSSGLGSGLLRFNPATNGPIEAILKSGASIAGSGRGRNRWPIANVDWKTARGETADWFGKLLMWPDRAWRG